MAGPHFDSTAREAVEASLAEQQRVLALLFERTEQGIWFIDNDLRTTDANPAMCRMLGLTLPSILGRDIYSFVDADNAHIFREQVARRDAGQAQSYEITLLRSDGGVVHCYNNATPIFDATGRKIGAVGMFSDISPLKRAEQQVQRTGELLAQKSHVLESTLNSLSQGVLSIGAQRRVNAYNQRFLELLEIPAALMESRPSGQQLREYQLAHGLIEPESSVDGSVPGPTWPPRYQKYQRKRRDGMVIEVQTHRHDADGLVRTYTDVTANVQAQQALQESETRFRTMADAAPAFIWLAHADGSAVWFNQRWLDCTGRTMEAELALPWPSRMHRGDLERCRAIFYAAVERQAPFELEFRLRLADGGHVWIVDHGIPRHSSDGRFDGFVVYGWDITARKASEAALIAAKDEAERANRAKSEFLSRMSHELRTPLNAVLGFAQLMAGDTADALSASQQARTQELLRGGRHLLSLINDVLDLARIEAGTLHLALAPVSLAAVVQDCLPLVQAAAAKRGIVVQVQPGAADVDSVHGDPIRLKQVLLNLLSNAIKYNRIGGHVQLTWRREPADSVRIEVRDSGPGLSKAQQDRLFHAFERLDAGHSDVEGAGIGLALSKWLVDLMGGQIGVHSTIGEGSLFWVALALSAPGATAALPLPPAAAQPRDPPSSRQHTVLYIEDNEVNQLLMEGMLAHRPGIRLLMAGLPEQGLALAVQERPDLVLLDIQLPGMNGFEVLQHLRQHATTRNLPVVAVSANAMPSDREQAARAGFQDYVTKPVDMPALLVLVDRLLAA